MSDIIKRSEFDAVASRFLEIVKDNITVEREISFALQAINKSRELAACSMESKQQSVLNVANIGLTLNPAMNLAYLVPRWDGIRKEKVCTLMPSYQGLVKLLTDSGSVTSCSAGVVKDGDEYDYQLGTSAYFTHKPKLGNTGKIIAAYAIATLHDGTKQIEILDKNDLDKVRDASESYKAHKEGKIKSCVWVDWEPEMCRKTAIKRLSKYLPKTDRWDKVASAIEADNQEYVLDPNGKRAEYILELANKVREGVQFEDIRRQVMMGMSESDASKLLEELKADYDPMTHDANPSATAITKHVANISGEKN